MPLQDWIHYWEVGAGARLLKLTPAVLAFAVAACLYDALDFRGFSSEEAMESAQLARNLSAGKGYSTESIRPLSIYLLQRAGPPGQSGEILQKPVPDTRTAPIYPLLLAGLMKVLPFDFSSAQWWSYPPERWIAGFNQVLFFLSVVLLFRIAARLFDARVGWLAAILFGGTDLFWNFSISGLSTSWVILIFLAVVWCLLRIEEHGRDGSPARLGAIGLAVLAGGLVGLGALSRYSFGWLIVPVLWFAGAVSAAGRGRRCLAAGAAFLLVMSPWLARNLLLTRLPFGDSTFAVIEATAPFPGDTLERSFTPQNGFHRLAPLDLVDKFLSNANNLWRDELPRLGVNWACGFFFVGLMIPFQKPARGRMRWFLTGSILILFVAQALGQTHVAQDSPDVNSENLLALVAPLAFVYGAALFFILLDQWEWATPEIRGAAIGMFVILLCAPLIMTLLLGRPAVVNSPYSPLQIQRLARLLRPDELMTSDIPGGVAWYGNRSCAWLPLDDDRQFYVLNSFKPVKALYLTQRTTDQRFLAQIMLEPKSWGHFLFDCETKEEVPDGFPLAQTPKGFLPYQLFLSDKPRWRMPPP